MIPFDIIDSQKIQYAQTHNKTTKYIFLLKSDLTVLAQVSSGRAFSGEYLPIRIIGIAGYGIAARLHGIGLQALCHVPYFITIGSWLTYTV